MTPDETNRHSAQFHHWASYSYILAGPPPLSKLSPKFGDTLQLWGHLGAKGTKKPSFGQGAPETGTRQKRCILLYFLLFTFSSRGIGGTLQLADNEHVKLSPPIWLYSLM